MFAWERPLRRGDLEALGDAAPDGPVLAIRVAGLEAKESLLAEFPDVCFTTPHFRNYPAVLIRLAECSPDDLTDLLTDAWLSRAPKRVAQQYLDSR